MEKAILQTKLNDIKLLRRGKVRDIYDLGEYLLLVASDRVSAFDVVLPNGIPGKGKILTQISIFWFNEMKDIISNHLIATDVKDFPAVCHKYSDQLEGRSMLVKKSKPLPVECIVRGYLSGSGWKEYKEKGTVCGIKLKNDLLESAKLDEPIFTPSTKADEGHDINISFDEAKKILGQEMAENVRELSLRIYKKAGSLAEKRGIIIADTKFEFGVYNNELILIDEILTPDSSRFWSARDYRVGKGQDSFDKQIVRDYLLTLNWNQQPPGPKLPEDIIEKAGARYKEILGILTGRV
jgi:phosphoribosylaminoimidazole-succinocarboxamide synthase